MASKRIRFCLLTLLALFVIVGGNKATGQVSGLIEFSAAGRLQRGIPLVSLAQEIVVMGRDGWLHSIDPTQPETQLKSLDGDYQPLSAVELRSQLRAEFGSDFEVVATQNFLVVQPKNRGDRWAKLFEQSHRGFVAYMSKRGVHVRQGRFPMVAIVFPDSNAMYDEFKKQKIDVSRVAGIYSNNSNRVMTHDSGHFSLVAATVRHEAAHQSAFNTGVHSRLNNTPKWITEGIGQLFEPQATTNMHTTAQRRERVNRESLDILRSSYPREKDAEFNQAIFDMISGDEMFADEPQVQNAYSVAWAMMFYLAERQPREFAKILNHTATRRPFTTYGRNERRDDFEAVIGMDAAEFSKRVRRFLDSL
ncbi:hypothetical protein Pla52o_47440 [Novipirellula galeiformis]|uniref:DUF1570 domain-containing protein n=1 Tax=Novipirellula galeiformis TaxID=2528004 RepID=A0A5C6CBN3_9BACT|nr:DUF1570 domain-containing protein [Novipirellula galeiformis]TWU20229.1 hypothetical protein Pla52o_47440 [Novipirellula galeiformis]